MIKNCNICWWTDLGYPGEYVYGDDIYIDEWYMDERWLPIKGAEGYFWVSTHARIWNVTEERFVKRSPSKSGYIDIEIKLPNGRTFRKYLHIIVAEAFIPNPNNYPFVLHGDDNPSNCCVWNLRWGTPTHNMRDCIERGRFRFFTDEDREAAMQKRRKPLIAHNIRTGEEYEFISQNEAARELGLRQADISNVICGLRKHVSGWVFVDVGDEIPDINSIDTRRHAKLPHIRARNIDTGVVMYFKGLTAAATRLNMSVASVSNVLHEKQRFAKRWLFEYMDEEEYDG